MGAVEHVRVSNTRSVDLSFVEHDPVHGNSWNPSRNSDTKTYSESQYPRIDKKFELKNRLLKVTYYTSNSSDSAAWSGSFYLDTKNQRIFVSEGLPPRPESVTQEELDAIAAKPTTIIKGPDKDGGYQTEAHIYYLTKAKE